MLLANDTVCVPIKKRGDDERYDADLPSGSRPSHAPHLPTIVTRTDGLLRSPDMVVDDDISG
jgi:hypothetical protein